MKAYNKDRVWTKGLAGCRRSCSSCHRKRCLRVDKRTARQAAKRSFSLEAE